MKKYLFLLLLSLGVNFLFPDNIFAQGSDEIDGSIMSTPEERSLSPEEKAAEAAAQVSKTKTLKECEDQKNQLIADCKKKLTANSTAEEKSQCSIKPKSEYDNCLKFVDPAEIKKNSDESEFELPAGLNELNQFQGLTLSEVIGNFMGMAMKILGSIAFALMVGAGLTWMTAGGNSDRQRKALDTMVWAALGVVLILSSATIVKFVFDAFTN